jgi:hypothetical protein
MVNLFDIRLLASIPDVTKFDAVQLIAKATDKNALAVSCDASRTFKANKATPE